MGIRMGSRLEALRTLRRRTQHELDAARRRDEPATTTARLRGLLTNLDAEILTLEDPPPAAAPTPAPAGVATDHVTRHLQQLGVTAHQVKTWAVGQGLIPAIKRGRIAGALVDQYAAAHTHTHATSGEPR